MPPCAAMALTPTRRRGSGIDAPHVAAVLAVGFMLVYRPLALVDAIKWRQTKIILPCLHLRLIFDVAACRVILLQVAFAMRTDL